MILITTVISCQTLLALLVKIEGNKMVSDIQKRELINTLKREVPSCPVVITNKNPK